MMYKYEIIIYWSKDDNCYIGEVPELAGCISDGTCPYELINNIETAIDEWIQTSKSLGREIPEPKVRVIGI